MIETKTTDILIDEYYLNMGPQHPSTHGVLRLVLRIDGEVVLEAVPDLGYLHRGIEKIAENRKYNQFLPFVDRLDYVTAMLNEHGYCMAVEKLLNVQVPPRAEHIRVIVAELNRIASHLVFYGPFAMDLGAITPFLYAFRERERIIDLLESLSGQRLTYAYMRIGGVRFDVPEGFTDKVLDFCKYFKPKVDEYEDLFTQNSIFLQRTKNVGVLTRDMAINYGCSGPVLRGSGVKYDVRKDCPYSIYPNVQFDVPVGTVGDSWDRYKVRMEEMRQSVRIIEQAVAQLPSGDIMAPVSKVIRPAVGEAYVRVESSRGDLGFFIVSDGTTNPYRLKVRAPSFSNLSVIPELVRGLGVSDVVAVLGSIDIVLGEVDR
jgi:NADH-quinone oxidoreductase subunit D